MNTSIIADMIRENPKIEDDIPSFLKEMNEKNIRRTDSYRTIVEDKFSLVSIADMNGGEATERDVKDALDLIAKEPLLEEANARIGKVIEAIHTGEIEDSKELISKFSE